MTNKVNYAAKFIAILNRKDILMNADILTELYESYNVVTGNGVKLLSLKKRVKTLPNTRTKEAIITCETDKLACGSSYDENDKMPNNTACMVYRLLTQKYQEQQKILVGTQKTKA
jgi:hypothetical protein